jgi:hypothetical protein
MFYISILHNIKENRFHPIYYRYSPMPGSMRDHTKGIRGQEEMVRWKSGGHHTEGFRTWAQTMEYFDNMLKKFSDRYHMPVYYDKKDIQKWDGEEVPATQIVLALSGLKMYE